MMRPIPSSSGDTAATTLSLSEHASRPAYTGLKIQRLLDAYRRLGFIVAKTNPLRDDSPPLLPELCPTHHGLTPSDQLAEVDLASFYGGNVRKVKELCDKLDQIYCGPIGMDCDHIRDSTVKEWLWRELEVRIQSTVSASPQRIARLERLVAAEAWEHYLQDNYPECKRFSLEGCESLLPLLDEVVHRAAFHGVSTIAMGMSHRGRVNTLVNFLRMPFRRIERLIQGTADNESSDWDLKYHLGAQTCLDTEYGQVEVFLAHNPSHLEAVTPVVLGMARAMQDKCADRCRRRILPLVLHGDAAFAGQGIVMEALNLSGTHGFGVGGAIHVVINNQIGFTTSDPRSARSSAYCTDIARFIDAPVIHVNVDDPDHVALAVALAIDYRMTFGAEIVIDLIGYRRRGHNEQDIPSFTQPLMQARIDRHPAVVSLYESNLLREAIIDTCFVDRTRREYLDYLTSPPAEVVSSSLELNAPEFLFPASPVGEKIHLIDLQAVVQTIACLPDGFVLHPGICSMLDHWIKTVCTPSGRIDWCLAENLAYGTLLMVGRRIRLTGMDVGRGTFCHRHVVWHDQGPFSRPGDQVHVPLRQLATGRGEFDVFDSPLSEASVLGFEYGYSVAAQQDLLIWEAQYGDFVNNAQVIVDQFISTGQAKWDYMSRLTLLLPHGHEGWGPEHSNGHLARFLQLCAGSNMRVTMPSTSAQWFHLIRQQALVAEATPLIVFTPKTTLYREQASHSQLEEFSNGQFHTVIDDYQKDKDTITKIVLCSGKLYFDLELAAASVSHVAVVRLEQLFPFPSKDLSEILSTYRNVQEVVWAQEEHLNHGAWHYIRDDLQRILSPRVRLSEGSRPAAAPSARCHPVSHIEEQRALILAVISTGCGFLRQSTPER